MTPHDALKAVETRTQKLAKICEIEELNEIKALEHLQAVDDGLALIIEFARTMQDNWEKYPDDQKPLRREQMDKLIRMHTAGAALATMLKIQSAEIQLANSAKKILVDECIKAKRNEQAWKAKAYDLEAQIKKLQNQHA